jgi:hypothetical protein
MNAHPADGEEEQKKFLLFINFFFLLIQREFFLQHSETQIVSRQCGY